MNLNKFIKNIPWLDEFRTEALAVLGAAGCAFFDQSFNITKIISPGARELLDNDKPVIVALYHGRLIGMLHIIERREKLTALVSRSRDGEFLARMGQKMGYQMARGSPAYRAIEGAKQLIDAAKSGQSLVIAIDGPRGPIYEPKEGVIRLAELTGLPILPFVCIGTKNHFFKGWDKMMGCYFGSDINYMIGDPIYVPAKLTADDREKFRQQLAKTMQWLRESLDKYHSLRQSAF